MNADEAREKLVEAVKAVPAGLTAASVLEHIAGRIVYAVLADPDTVLAALGAEQVGWELRGNKWVADYPNDGRPLRVYALPDPGTEST